MKIFVTGCSGQLGYDVAAELNSRGFEILATDILPEATGLPEIVNYLQLDIADQEAVFDAMYRFQPDAVIHCAAWTAVDAAEEPENREKVFAINAQGTRNLAEACNAVGAKLLYISTDYIFDGTGTAPWQPDVFPGFPARAEQSGRRKIPMRSSSMTRQLHRIM